MTRKVQEMALSFFLAAAGVSLLLGMFWLKPLIDSQRQLVEETRANQARLLKGAEQTRAILTEVGYAAAVLTMMESGIVKPAEGNKMLEKSIAALEVHSERFGKLLRLMNDHRINQQASR